MDVKIVAKSVLLRFKYKKMWSELPREEGEIVLVGESCRLDVPP